MKKLICFLIGHRWLFTARFPFLGGGPATHTIECKRCGLKREWTE